MRLVQLNLAADYNLAQPQRLLDRYHTLTGWSRALADAGAQVSVVQRFVVPGEIAHEGVPYTFVSDDEAASLDPWAVSAPALDAVVRVRPDVVHVNGLMFPAMTLALRQRLGSTSAIVLQDHSGVLPSRLATILERRKWSHAFAAVDACTFTARELAARWHSVGLPRELPVLEIPEASTTFRALDRESARARIALSGTPIVLWVGRLDANKDPMTVLSGVECAAASMPSMQVSWISPERTTVNAVTRRIQASPTLSTRVRMRQAVPHDEMPLFYSAADIFVSGSYHEGSGYALIEALACGVIPCVTDIPSFHALAGDLGVFWRPGDANGCAQALLRATERISPQRRHTIHAQFDSRLSWDAIGRRTLAAYTDIAHRRQART